MTAWSVSSVTRPAGRPALISLTAGPGANQGISPNRSLTVALGSIWVGMPRASPTASP
jgi:hypothetical protein